MKTIALMYHDVVTSAAGEESGFPGSSALHYKLTPESFGAHLTAIAGRVKSVPAAVANDHPDKIPQLMLTFDDGGISAIDPIAKMLEKLGWRGQFFITTDRINTPGFLTAAHIRELHSRGHGIASHTCSHPRRLSAIDPRDIHREWRDSCKALAAIIGQPVTVASVPGGFYSREVAKQAAAAGIRTLFTSEPTVRKQTCDGCTIIGRYTLWRSSTPEQAANLAAGSSRARYQQSIAWSAKKIGKRLAGPLYLGVRERMLRRRHTSPGTTGELS